MAAPLFADYLAERRVLLRKLSYWRIAAFSVLILGVAAAGLRLLGPESSLGFTPHIARLAIEGVITGDRETLKLIQRIEDSKGAEAVLITIDSPGGTTSGAERLYDALRLSRPRNRPSAWSAAWLLPVVISLPSGPIGLSCLAMRSWVR